MPKSYNILRNLNNIFLIHCGVKRSGVFVQHEPKVSLFESNFVLTFRGSDYNGNYSVWDVVPHSFVPKITPSSGMGD